MRPLTYKYLSSENGVHMRVWDLTSRGPLQPPRCPSEPPWPALSSQSGNEILPASRWSQSAATEASLQASHWHQPKLSGLMPNVCCVKMLVSGLLSAIAFFTTWQTPFLKSPKLEYSLLCLTCLYGSMYKKTTKKQLHMLPSLPIEDEPLSFNWRVSQLAGVLFELRNINNKTTSVKLTATFFTPLFLHEPPFSSSYILPSWNMPLSCYLHHTLVLQCHTLVPSLSEAVRARKPFHQCLWCCWHV